MLPNTRGRGEAAESHREDGCMTEQPNEIDVALHVVRAELEGEIEEAKPLAHYRQAEATLLLAKQVQRIADQIERWGQNGIFTRSE